MILLIPYHHPEGSSTEVLYLSGVGREKIEDDDRPKGNEEYLEDSNIEGDDEGSTAISDEISRSFDDPDGYI